MSRFLRAVVVSLISGSTMGGCYWLLLSFSQQTRETAVLAIGVSIVAFVVFFGELRTATWRGVVLPGWQGALVEVLYASIWAGAVCALIPRINNAEVPSGVGDWTLCVIAAAILASTWFWKKFVRRAALGSHQLEQDQRLADARRQAHENVEKLVL